MKNKQETFKDIMERFRFHTDIRNAFDDFLTLTLCSFGQIPGAGKSYDEELYLQTIAKYPDKKVQTYFPELLACLITEMTNRMQNNDGSGWDILGEYYEAHCAQKGLSQFFTPWPVCTFMAKCTVEEAEKSKGTEDRPLRIIDPCCGSGRMLMAASRVAGATHEYYGIDLDPICVKMTIINLFLSGLFHSEVMHGNALAADDFRVSYKSSLLPFGVFRIQDKTQSRLWHLMQNTLAANKPPKYPAPDLNPTHYPEGSQLKIF
ncbi:MAG: N-6 DNA methylase [Bacteroidetes bacterium]|nr:N-6 DNA methylase [Bacteroidota bacterium]